MSRFVAKIWVHSSRFLGLLVFVVCGLAWSSDERPGTAEIEQSLESLQVTGSALMIGAHPDDENTAVLAWLARGRHVRTGYLSLTRGEGGQNLIGSEQGDALGVIRTQELLAARRIDGAQQFFTRAIDFGFSKSPKESLAKWGHDEILSDVVWVIRRFQPDVIILRFSGTPEDGHGQHQASAILGREAYDAAADPAKFPGQLKWVKPWRAKRLVWNTFAFTPEQEKKVQAIPLKVKVDTGAYNPVLGESYGQIAGMSRSQHRSQGMGVPEQRGESSAYFTPVGGAPFRSDLFDDIDTTWKRFEGGGPISGVLARAQRELSPENPQLILPMLIEARKMIAALAKSGEPRALEKLQGIDDVIAGCAGLWVDASSDRASAFPGDAMQVNITVLKRLQTPGRWKELRLRGSNIESQQTVDAALEDNRESKREVKITVPAAAPYSQPFWLVQPHDGDRYRISDQTLIGRAAPLPVMTADLNLEIGGAPIHLEVPVHYRYVDHVRGELTRPFEIGPIVALDLGERTVIFPQSEPRTIVVRLHANATDTSGELKLDAPAGWRIENSPAQFHLAAAGDEQEFSFQVEPAANSNAARAQFRAVALVKGREIAIGTQSIQYEHIPPQVIFRPSDGVLQPVDLKVLAKNVGYVMGAGDRVPDAIRQMGVAVTLLNEDDLLRGDLSRFQAIVAGVRAYNVRHDLVAAHPRLLDYVRSGGTFIVQYNVPEFRRPGDVPLQAMLVGPYPIEVARERVTEEDAPVHIEDPRSPLLNEPNQIAAADFSQWIQERGLYFASKWDKHYSTIVDTHDTGEKDLPGGILFTRYGKGIYIFTAYAWFRELPAGVPGAYRIFANLLSAGQTMGDTAASQPSKAQRR